MRSNFDTVYRPDIDGLRALAIGLVIVFHAELGVVSGGYVGVDVFFVISGYLITKIIYSDLHNNRFSFKRFWIRRARRLLPSMILVLSFTFIVFYNLYSPKLFYDMTSNLISQIFFVSNIYLWKNTNYFDVDAGLRPLLHMWSLSVEEQFYIFYPVIVCLIFKFKRNLLFPLLCASILLSLALAIWAAAAKPVAGFFLLPTRAWELGLGAGLALLSAEATGEEQVPPWLLSGASVVGLAMILASAFWFSSATPFPSYRALLPCVGTAMIMWSGGYRFKPLITKLFSNSVLIYIGLISYSLYLWHWVLFVFADNVNIPIEKIYLKISVIFFSVVFAALTYRFLENPIRKKTLLRSNSSFAASIFVPITVLSGLSIYSGVSGGIPDRFNQDEKNLLAYNDYNIDEKYRLRACFLHNNQRGFEDKAGCLRFGVGNNVLIWGDSHAAHLYIGINDKFPSDSNVSQFTAMNCPPFEQEVQRFNLNCNNLVKDIKKKIERKKFDIIILSANWFYHQNAKYFERNLRSALDFSKKNSEKTVLIGPTPMWKPSLPEHLVRVASGELPEMINMPLIAELRKLDKSLSKISMQYGAIYVSLIENLCEGTKCRASVGGASRTPLAWDEAHYTEGGSKFVAGIVHRSLARE